MQIRRTAVRLSCILCSLSVMLSAAGCDSSRKQEDELTAMLSEFKADMRSASDNDGSANTGLRIGSVNMGMNGEWFSEAMNGIWDAAQDLGATAMMLDSEGSMEKEKENIRRLVEDGIDALVISPRDSNESIEALQPAVDAGIPIVTWNTSVNMDITSFVCVDSNALGGDTGDYLCEYIKTYGLDEINLVVVDNKNYDVGVARCEGFTSSIKTMVDQGIIHIVAQDDAETFDSSVELITGLVNEHPEINAVWVWNQPALLGAVEAVRQTGRTDILVMGADMSMELAHDMLGSDVNLLSITTQMPYNMGYKAVVTAAEAAMGKTVDKTVLIPLFTYTKNDRELVERYITAHQGLIEWKGGQWYEE